MVQFRYSTARWFVIIVSFSGDTVDKLFRPIASPVLALPCLAYPRSRMICPCDGVQLWNGVRFYLGVVSFRVGRCRLWYLGVAGKAVTADLAYRSLGGQCLRRS